MVAQVDASGLKTETVYHADGVLCPVTFAMHLAAAVPLRPGQVSRAAVIIAVLVVLNGLFVAAEFAIIGVPRSAIEHQASRGSRLAELVLDVLADPKKQDRYIATAQLGITLASLGLGWVGEPAFAHLLEPLLAAMGVDTPEVIRAVSFFTAFFIISYLHIVVGELAPKSWAIRKPELLSLWTAVPLYLFYWAMYPAIYLLNASANAILRIAGQGEPGPHHEHHYSREELKLILHSSRAGAVAPNPGCSTFWQPSASLSRSRAFYLRHFPTACAGRCTRPHTPRATGCGSREAIPRTSSTSPNSRPADSWPTR